MKKSLSWSRIENFSTTGKGYEKRHQLQKHSQKMKASRIGVSAVCIAISIAAAASNAVYFFSTNHASTANTICEEETFRASSTISCAFRCTQMHCSRFRWNKGVCRVRRRSTSQLSGGLHFVLKKVSIVHSLNFTLTLLMCREYCRKSSSS